MITFVCVCVLFVLLQATAEEHKYFLYVCESEGQLILYSILFGYKGVLQALALLLAFRTRHVKVKGLDDSVYIAASVYVSSIVLAVIIVSTYTLRDYVNIHPAVVGMGKLLGTTTILALVFLPRVSYTRSWPLCIPPMRLSTPIAHRLGDIFVLYYEYTNF